MANSTAVAKTAKPSKPYVGFPLTIHPSGRFCKKIRGTTYYFGSWADGWQKALDRYNRERDYLHNGQAPPPTDGLTVKQMVNDFLNAKRAKVESGEISPRSLADYITTCERVAKVFTPGRMVETLRPDDFAKLRTDLSNGKRKQSRGAVSVSNDVGRTRSLFKYAFDMGWLATPVRFGPEFKKPSKKIIRKQRRHNGSRAFTADELRKLLANATQPLRAMIWLAINCGFGQSDLSSLPISAVDLKGGWINFPRPKTGADRRCPLWLPTQLALAEWLQRRPESKDAADAGLVFLTRCRTRWCKVDPTTGQADDAISKEFAKLLKRLGMKRAGVQFYALRRTFRTIADSTLDQPAARLIMGHIDSGIEDHYREFVLDARLQNVVDYVFAWLFPTPRVDA